MHTAMLTLQISRGLQAKAVAGNTSCHNIRNGYKLASHFSNGCHGSGQQRYGPNGIQMLSKYLHKQIFGKTAGQQWDAACLQRSCKELERHGLKSKNISFLEDVILDLPSLHGDNIDDHFRCIAGKQLEAYMRLINEILAVKLPPTPTQWSMREGWSRYEHDGSYTQIDYPLEECLVLDVEVCVQEGGVPTLAVAVSPTCWYSWVSHRLASGQGGGEPHRSWGLPDELISLGDLPDKARLVIGHNVCYDRARIKEQYNINNSNVRFLDTLSLHTCVAGQTAGQKLIWKKRFGESPWEVENSYERQKWYHMSSPGDLTSVYWLHCGKIIDKSKRDLFVTGDTDIIRKHFQELMQYCCNDVYCTHELLCSLFPQFQEHCPHPVTLAGMLEMGSAYLPVNEQWDKYVYNCDQVYDEIMKEIKERLMGLANEAVKHQENDRYRKDIWLTNLDWTVKKKARHLRGYPDWYRKLCPKQTDGSKDPIPLLLTPQMRVTPYLLRMTWNGHPLFHHKTKKWGYLVLQQDNSLVNTENDNAEIDTALYLESLSDLVKEEHDNYGEQWNGYDNIQGPSEDEVTLEFIKQKALFYRLPHKDGPTNNVGNPLSRDFLSKMDDGTLCSQSGEDGRRILLLNSMISFWRSSHDRIRDQFVVWLDPESHQSDKRIGIIVPQLIAAGTVTRRAVEATWLTASNPKDSRVGSELKSLVRAPNGYQLIGADVDSQELWIASVIGDAHFAGMHGSTAVGWMTLQGKKSDGTDLHSKTAATIGITRDQAKVFNYGRIYGAGNPFAIQLLKQFNSKISDDEAEEKATKLYAATKGIRRYILSHLGVQLAEEYGIIVAGDSSIDWKQYRSLREMLLGDRNKRYKYMPRVIKQSYWSGGSESHMFNKLEQIATSSDPATPVLGCKITRALKPKYVGTKYMTSRINWVVQSSAVDYLHLMLVCMRWLINSYHIDARFCISIHDEVRYLVKSEDQYRTALALQVTNLLTRSMFSFKLGINDLPQSVAFFSAVDIDKVLRKEVNMDCHTPSNPLGLEKSQGIPQGEALDIYQVIKLTGGKLSRTDNLMNKTDD